MSKREFWDLINEYESNSFAIYFLTEHKRSVLNLRISIDMICRRQDEIHTLLMNACVVDPDECEEA
jgi:hypothetical protein